MDSAATLYQADYYRPWFNLVREAKLDVSYIESLSFREFASGPSGANGVPEELARFDVILLADGGIVDLSLNKSLMLSQFIESGMLMRHRHCEPGRLSESVLHANRLLEPLGLHMVDQDLDGLGPGYPGDRGSPNSSPRCASGGVKKLTTSSDRQRRSRSETRRLRRSWSISLGSQDGFVAISREGHGELVAIGVVNLPEWIGKRGQGTDNARFLKNLLTTKVH